MKKLGGKNRCVSRTGPALSEWETEAWVLCPHRGNSLSQTDSETADLFAAAFPLGIQSCYFIASLILSLDQVSALSLSLHLNLISVSSFDFLNGCGLRSGSIKQMPEAAILKDVF